MRSVLLSRAFHNRRLYRPEYAPIGFSYAVRRPGHDPEGVLSIDDARDDNQPVPTTCRHIVHGHVMKIALGPSMQVSALPSLTWFWLLYIFDCERVKRHYMSTQSSIFCMSSQASMRVCFACLPTGGEQWGMTHHQIPFHGEHFVHSAVFHRFSNGAGSGPKLHLVARARQFSSFILMVGVLPALL